MTLSQTWACGLLGLLTAWGVGRLIRRVSFLADKGRRSVQFHHSGDTPIPRFGGIALAGAFVVVFLVACVWRSLEPLQSTTYVTILLSSLAMFGVGLWDDFRPLGAKRKLLLQILIASLVYWCGVQIQAFKNPLTGTEYSLGPWGYAATVFWLVALTNLINLIDGIDGLAAGISLLLMCLLAYVGHGSFSFIFVVAVGMAGALLGFLYHNFPPAKIYLGDGGAYFLGFLIGILAIANSHKGTVVAALIAPIFALGLPIIDTSLAILRRGLKGLPIFRPDRKHIHHLLVSRGFSRRRAVLTLYALSLVFLLMALLIFWSESSWIPVLSGVVFVGVILSVPSLGFVPDWLAVGRVLGKSLEMRKETRYVLALTTWFELEAERCDSVEEIWVNFQFVAGKLGLSHLSLGLADKVCTWQTNDVSFSAETLQRYCHEYGGKTLMVLELLAPPQVLSPQLFEHFAELAAESWQKAAELWQASAQLPFRFESARSPEKCRSRSRRAALVSADAHHSEHRGSRPAEIAASSVRASENEVLVGKYSVEPALGRTGRSAAKPQPTGARAVPARSTRPETRSNSVLRS